MANKWIFVGFLLVMAVVILGCSEKQSAETQGIQTQAELTPSAEPAVKPQPSIPVYQAPLQASKIRKTCSSDNDCRLILVQTGAGQTRECISIDSSYEGAISEECYCKYIGTTTQTLINGTDIKTENYECRHIA